MFMYPINYKDYEIRKGLMNQCYMAFVNDEKSYIVANKLKTLKKLIDERECNK